MFSLPIVDHEVFERYAGLSLPRHVSYPMPTWWHDVDPHEATSIREESLQQVPQRDLSIYLHIPFCEALCKFCACNKTIMRKTAKNADENVSSYVKALLQEMSWRASTLGAGRCVRQIHWGGGTPTYLSCQLIEKIHHTLASLFDIHCDAEISIEVDPRVTSSEQLQLLRHLGFNRISLGVQDFDERVQKHIHRVQPYELVKQCVETCREFGFKSLNFDLIYGLPYQTVDTVADMVDKSISLSPDRVAFYHYAQIPDKIATQRGIHHQQMPDSKKKLAMFLLAVERFQSAGYEFIGLDHFAKADETLAQAARQGTINRNFQGMTTGVDLDLIGIGASSISQFVRFGYLQNHREPQSYVDRIQQTLEPAIRGIRLNEDDCLRQTVINHLYCYAEICPERIEALFDIVFDEYFATELEQLEQLQSDDLVNITSDNRIQLTFPLGRVLMRNVAAIFDAYINRDAYRFGEKHAFSTNA